MRETVPVDILGTAIETYGLEVALGGLDKDALTKALSAAILAHERQVIDRIARVLEALAQDDDDDGTASLMRAAAVIRSELPMASAASIPYLPVQDDIAEVVLAGRVHIAQETCASCGHESHSLWSLYDFATGAEYFFDEAELQQNLRIRVLRRAHG